MRLRPSLLRSFSLFLGLALVVSVSSALFPQKTYAILGVGDVVFDPANDVQNTISAVENTDTAVSSNITSGATTVTAGATTANAGFAGITSITSAEQLLKNTALDPIAWAVSKAVLQSVVNSTVNWINHGFNGAPGFTTNLNSTLQAVSDSAANSFISQLSTNGSIKSPFQTQIANAVSTNYLQSTSATGFFTQNAYTLNKVTSNDSGFLGGNFSDGGWNAWMSAVINPQNNPYGAYVLASAAASQQVSSAKQTQTTELNWAQGFLSSRGNCPTSTTGGSTGKTSTGGSTSLSQNSTCQSSSIQTPGSVIDAQLNKALGTGNDTLVTAHEVDELVNALLGQLTKAVIGPGGGLSGLSQPSSTTGGTTYFAQTDPSQTAINASLGTSFSTTISGQLSSIQKYQSQWTAINNAAQSALAALSSNSCSTNQNIINSIVEPVISQATTALSQASSSIEALENIQAELPNPNSTADQTTALNQASTDYSNISATLPSASQLAYAQAQSVDNSSSLVSSNNLISPTLFTQMNQFVEGGSSCQTLSSSQPTACEAATAASASACQGNSTSNACETAADNIATACQSGT